MNSFIEKVRSWFKKSSFGLILTSIAIVMVVSVGLLINSNNSSTVNRPTESFTSVSESSSTNKESSTPIIIEEEKVQTPFKVDASIARYFFDSSDSIEIKSQALINYENKFVPSLGVCYTFNNTPFSVMSSFDGKVVKKVNDSLYGLTIIVENEEGLRAHYCGLSDVVVNENEKITQGKVIGKTGESIINASLGNHLYFALEYENDFINPLKAYNKTIDEVIA